MLCTRIGMTFEMVSRVLLLLTCWQTLHRCAFSLQPRQERTQICDYEQVLTCLNAREGGGQKMLGWEHLFPLIHHYSRLIVTSLKNQIWPFSPATSTGNSSGCTFYKLFYFLWFPLLFNHDAGPLDSFTIALSWYLRLWLL